MDEGAQAQGLEGVTRRDLYDLRTMPLAEGTKRKIKVTLRPEGGVWMTAEPLD